MIKRLIFDVDGTLITGANFKGAVTNTLKELNILTDENLELFMGAIKTYEQHYDNYNRKDYTEYFSRALKIALPDNFLDIFFYFLKDCVPPRNKKLIRRIYELSEKYELVLLTNYFSESQLNRLHKVGIDSFFQNAFGENKIKPFDEAYIVACGPHKPEECIMIGDDLILDIKRAREMGLNAIYVNQNKVEDCPTVSSVEEITIELIESIYNNEKIK